MNRNPSAILKMERILRENNFAENLITSLTNHYDLESLKNTRPSSLDSLIPDEVERNRLLLAVGNKYLKKRKKRKKKDLTDKKTKSDKNDDKNDNDKALETKKTVKKHRKKRVTLKKSTKKKNRRKG